jgi:DNA-directed RNA polymerase subunit E'/Rpb7|uniref:S1 motif domain-containing protein n=1 Tax=viral metagenome TaxID=1070528 RepID=A0A6C0IIU1_9ZZZZ
METKKPQDRKIRTDVYTKSMLTKKISLNMNQIGKNIKPNLEKSISNSIQGKCSPEGFIKPDSVRVISYTSGVVENEKIVFDTMYECMICHPVEGMIIECTSKTITKAGIHGQIIDEDGNVPIHAFIARDHFHNDKNFNNIEENQKVLVRVIGIRFELNDPYIVCMGELVNEK